MSMKVQSNSFHIQHDSFSEAEHLNGKLLEGNTVAGVTGDKNAVHPYRGYSFTRALTDGKDVGLLSDLTLTLSTFLPVVSINNDSKDQSDFSIRLKMYNEVQRCFLTVGLVYPDDLFLFLVNKCKVKEETLTFGGLCVLKHLLPSKIPLLVEAVKSLLEEPSLGVRKVLSELIVVMASHCYLVSSSGELFIEYLVRHCALTDNNRGDLDILNKRVERGFVCSLAFMLNSCILNLVLPTVLFAYTLICTGIFMCVVTCLGHMAAGSMNGEIKHSQAAHVTNLWRDFSSELIVEKIKCF
ncbi:hypothetical protein AHAS_Ahas15G0176900 [Arachis hypogaea]